MLAPGHSPSPACPGFCSPAGAHLPFPDLWSHPSVRPFGMRTRVCSLVFLGSKATNKISPCSSFLFFFFQDKQRFGGFSAFIPEQWEGCSGFHRAPLLFSGLFFVEGSRGHLPLQLSSLLSWCNGAGVPSHHHQLPPWTLFWGAVGSGGKRAEVSELAVTPQPHACCLAGLWSQAHGWGGGETLQKKEEIFV